LIWFLFVSIYLLIFNLLFAHLKTMYLRLFLNFLSDKLISIHDRTQIKIPCLFFILEILHSTWNWIVFCLNYFFEARLSIFDNRLIYPVHSPHLLNHSRLANFDHFTIFSNRIEFNRRYFPDYNRTTGNFIFIICQV
jgi:hypothetical protein